MDKVIEKTFGKYSVSLELFMEGDEQRSFCDIENPKTDACASLARASDMGFLETPHGHEEKISQNILDQIEDWAEENGY